MARFSTERYSGKPKPTPKDEWQSARDELVRRYEEGTGRFKSQGNRYWKQHDEELARTRAAEDKAARDAEEARAAAEEAKFARDVNWGDSAMAGMNVGSAISPGWGSLAGGLIGAGIGQTKAMSARMNRIKQKKGHVTGDDIGLGILNTISPVSEDDGVIHTGGLPSNMQAAADAAMNTADGIKKYTAEQDAAARAAAEEKDSISLAMGAGPNIGDSTGVGQMLTGAALDARYGSGLPPRPGSGPSTSRRSGGGRPHLSEVDLDLLDNMPDDSITGKYVSGGSAPAGSSGIGLSSSAPKPPPGGGVRPFSTGGYDGSSDIEEMPDPKTDPTGYSLWFGKRQR